MNTNNLSFAQLCWQSGYVLHKKVGSNINKTALCELLAVNVRTLNRWLAGASPCPRALVILMMQIKQMHPMWSDYYYDRAGKLGHKEWRLTYSPCEVRLFPELLKERHRLVSSRETLQRRYDEALCPHEQNKQRHALGMAINLLQDVSASSLLDNHDQGEYKPLFLVDVDG